MDMTLNKDSDKGTDKTRGRDRDNNRVRDGDGVRVRALLGHLPQAGYIRDHA